jgi:hypothetical protein
MMRVDAGGSSCCYVTHVDSFTYKERKKRDLNRQKVSYEEDVTNPVLKKS